MSTATIIIDKIAPRFAADSEKAWFISQARNRISDCAFGDNKERAVALRAAHDMTLRDAAGSTGGIGGQISNMKEGDLSIGFNKFGSGGSGEDDLSQTTYGNQLIGLRKGNIAAVGVLGGADDGC